MAETTSNRSNEPAQPTQTDLAKVLQLIQQRGLIRGRDLLSATGLAGPALVKVIASLISRGFVAASGDVSDPDAISGAHFSIRPSTSRAAYAFSQQPM